MAPGKVTCFTKLAVLILVFIDLASCNKPLQNMLDNIFKDYDKGIRPNFGIKPVEVSCTAYILSITDIDEKDNRFTVSLYYRESWEDPRLAYTPIPEINAPNGTVELYGDLQNAIWKPDTFVVNEITSFQHEFGQPNVLVRLAPNGIVLNSVLYTITASCPMDLSSFPFDSQLCIIELESFASTARDIKYKWRDAHKSIGISPDVSTPVFQVFGHRLRFSDISLKSGNYSRLSADLLFIRISRRYIYRYFLPMMMFVCISLLALWGVSPKIGAFVNFLNIGFVMLFMAENSSEMPNTSTLTAIDVYFAICIVHIFLALIDCLVASFFESRNTMAHEVIEMTSPRRSQTEDTANLCSDQPSFFRRKAVVSKFIMINTFIKIAIALIFVLCNIIFWPKYSSKPVLEEHFADIIPIEAY